MIPGTHFLRSKIIHRYAVAVVAVTVAVLLVAIYPPFKARGAFVLFLGAVSMATWYGGMWPGMVAIVLSAMAGIYYVLPPQDSTLINNPDDLLRLALFLFIGLLISSLHEARARTERSLIRSQERLQLALDQARMGVWDANIRTGDFWLSPNLPGIYGREAEGFAQSYEGMFAYTRQDDQDMVNRAVTCALEDGEDFEVRYYVAAPDGRVRRLHTRGRICFDDKGRAERMVGVTTLTEEGVMPERVVPRGASLPLSSSA